MTRSLLVLLVVLNCFLPRSALAKDHIVIIEAMKFTPAELQVKSGEKITWINKDFFPHTATARSNAFNSKSIPAGKLWSFQAKKAGVFDYKCLFHPPMKGRLIVK